MDDDSNGCPVCGIWNALLIVSLFWLFVALAAGIVTPPKLL